MRPLQVTLTSSRSGKFESKFYHKVYAEEFGNGAQNPSTKPIPRSCYLHHPSQCLACSSTPIISFVCITSFLACSYPRTCIT